MYITRMPVIADKGVFTIFLRRSFIITYYACVALDVQVFRPLAVGSRQWAVGSRQQAEFLKT